MQILTSRGADLFKERIANTERLLKETQSKKGRAAKVGGDDWHDNFTFEQLEREEQMLGQELKRLREILYVSQVIDQEQINSQPKDEVRIGSTVTIEYEDGKTSIFSISGHGESSPEIGIIAYDTPIGKSIMRKKVGDTGVFRTEKTEIHVTIKNIAW